MIPVNCPSCGYSNEPSRVFCHNCGVRLSRSEETVAKVAEENRSSDAKAKVLRRQRKALEEKKARRQDVLAGLIVSTFNIAIIAALFAVLILFLRLPENLPLTTEQDDAMAKAAEQQLERGLDSDYSGTLVATQEQINSFLLTSVHLEGRQMLNFGQVEMDRVFVVLGEQRFRLGVAYRFAGLLMAVQTEFSLEKNDERYDLHIQSGSIGSLPIHPEIFRRFLQWYVPVAESLKKPLDSLAKAKQIRISSENVTVTWESTNTTPASEPSSSRPLSPGVLRSPSLRSP